MAKLNDIIFDEEKAVKDDEGYYIIDKSLIHYFNKKQDYQCSKILIK